MPSQEEINQQQVLLNTHRRSLAILLRQKAVAPGASTPLPVEHGIVEARSNIRRVKNILSGWGVSVANHPDDEDDSSATLQPQTSNPSTAVSVPSATPSSKPSPQATQKWKRQRDLAWWAGITSIAALVVALGLWLLPNPFPSPQPSTPIGTEPRQPTSIQPTISPKTLTPSPVSSPEASAPTESSSSPVLNPSTECPSDAYEFVAQIPSELSIVGDVQFGKGLVATVNGSYLYVADTRIDGDREIPRIRKLTISGTIEMDWKVAPGPGDGEFGYAQAIGVGSDGSVYVADGVRNRIQKLDRNNKFRVWVDATSSAGNLNDPRSIGVDNQGYVYIADTLKNRILKFSSDGKLQGMWGSTGKGRGEFNQPWGIGVDTQRNIVYVADTENHRIQIFDSEGNYQGQWGENGSGDGQFTEPRGVSVDLEGNIYIADSSNHRIQKFSSTGKCLAKWGREGKDIGQFQAPLTVSVGTDGLVYIADSENSRIQVFREK